MSTWILSASRKEATVYGHGGRGQELVPIKHIEHPAGRLRDRDLNADRGGRAFDSHGQGRHALTSEELPHERVAASFARELAAELERGRVAGEYTQVILVAEPRMLGWLREALTPQTSHLVLGSLGKEYGSGEADALKAALSREFVL